MSPLEIFLAKGGKIQQVAEGVRSSTEKALYAASRGEVLETSTKLSAEEIVSRKYGNSLSDSQYLQAVEMENIERSD